MDGVVADFNSYAKTVLATDETSHSWPPEIWKKLSSNHRLYRDLEKTPEADRLVNFCKKVCNEKNWGLNFLTAVPKDDDMQWAYYDKINWVNKYYPNIPVFFGPHSNDKWKYCNIDDILIDDRPSNCTEWKKAGGVAILHTGDLFETVKQLSFLL